MYALLHICTVTVWTIYATSVPVVQFLPQPGAPDQAWHWPWGTNTSLSHLDTPCKPQHTQLQNKQLIIILLSLTFECYTLPDTPCKPQHTQLQNKHLIIILLSLTFECYTLPDTLGKPQHTQFENKHLIIIPLSLKKYSAILCKYYALATLNIINIINNNKNIALWEEEENRKEEKKHTPRLLCRFKIPCPVFDLIPYLAAAEHS